MKQVDYAIIRAAEDGTRKIINGAVLDADFQDLHTYLAIIEVHNAHECLDFATLPTSEADANGDRIMPGIGWVAAGPDAPFLAPPGAPVDVT